MRTFNNKKVVFLRLTFNKNCPYLYFIVKSSPWYYFWILVTRSQETHCQRTHLGSGYQLYALWRYLSPLLVCFHILCGQCTLCFGLCILDGYWCFIHGPLSETQSNELKTGDNACVWLRTGWNIESGHGIKVLRKNNIDTALSGCWGGWGY